MSEHSIEELERQYKSAQSKAQDAARAAQEAKSRLTQAKLDATGLNGHLVSYPRATWRNRETQEIRFVVRGLSGWRDDEVRGPIIRKDGTEGEREGRCRIMAVTDHGPYVEPTP